MAQLLSEFAEQSDDGCVSEVPARGQVDLFQFRLMVGKGFHAPVGYPVAVFQLQCLQVLHKRISILFRRKAKKHTLHFIIKGCRQATVRLVQKFRLT
jgi:hypothetical protein